MKNFFIFLFLTRDSFLPFYCKDSILLIHLYCIRRNETIIQYTFY